MGMGMQLLQFVIPSPMVPQTSVNMPEATTNHHCGWEDF